MTLDELYIIIKDKQLKMPANSYPASLIRDGRDRIIQKIGEEAVEVLIAAKNGRKKEIVEESADLFFHLILLFSISDVDLNDIFDELGRRNKKS